MSDAARETPPDTRPPAIVVTKHAGVLQVLQDAGLVQVGDELLERPSEEYASGKHIIIAGPGVSLPMSVAAAAFVVTEVPVRIPIELARVALRGSEVAAFVGSPHSYFTIELEPGLKAGFSWLPTSRTVEPA